MRRIDMNQTLDLIYSAITRPELWAEVVQSLVAAVSSNTGLLCVEKPEQNRILAYSDYGFDQKAITDYVDHYVSTDLWVDGMYTRPANQFYVSQEVTPQRQFLESELYNDWAKYQNMHHATGIYVDSPQDVALRLCLQRSKREGEYTQEEQQALNSIAPHLRRAITVHNDLVEQRLATESPSRILDQMPFAALLLDEKHRIHYHNAGAERLISEGCSLIDQAGTLTLGELDTDFRMLVSQSIAAAQGKGRLPGGSLNIRGKTGSRYEVSVSPLVLDDFQLCLQYQRVMALVIVRDTATRITVSQHVLRLYGFTKTEANVAQLLCQGLSASQIAVELNRSFNTVRTHIRNILYKTESRSQVEAVAKLLASIRAD